MNDVNDLYYRLALWLTPGIGPKAFAVIEHAFADLREFFSAPEHLLRQLKLSTKTISALKHFNWQVVDQHFEWAQQSQHHIVSINDQYYPQLLAQIAAPPPILFVKGDISVLSQSQLAMVGSRNPSVNGIDNANAFAKAFVEAGFTITSGLAIGIDAACHRGALAVSGQTIAVVGTGLDRVYPWCHRQLAQQIISCGAIVSEFPLGSPAKAQHFPRRNRIISGLSQGTIVVEAATQSGSLITARYALEQNREVFAIPGSIHNPVARGCHALIQEGAKLVVSSQDVLQELGMVTSTKPTIKQKQRQLAQQHQKLVKCIGYEPTAVDTIIERSGNSAQEVLSMLLELEMQDVIVTVPGGYVRKSDERDVI